MEKSKFQRNQEGSLVSYEVLNSSNQRYYIVEMSGLVGLSCECIGSSTYGVHCGHKRTAEAAERDFQAEQGEQRPVPSPDFHLDAPLNGNSGFSLMR